MVDTKENAAKQLREITECPICMNTFTDPRMLPCIHTFCFECLKRTGETAQKDDPGEKMPCPLCRKEFLIPADGINGVSKNFFMESLLQYKNTLQTGSVTIICDVCSASDESKTEQKPTAMMRCLECQDNYCDSCVKVHQFLKISRNHQLVKLGSDAVTSGIKRVYSVKYCSKHTQKLLDYYCAECKNIVCVSCFVEGHKLHDCKDIATVDEEFRQTIERNARKISNCADEMLVLKENVEKRKTDFRMEIIEKEKEIHKRSQELKEMIDCNTKSLLDELSVLQSNQLKKIEDEVEVIDTSCTILKNFEAYCNELRSKGSTSDICSSVDELIARADELERDHRAVIGRPLQSVEVTFKAADLKEVLQKFNNSIVGQIKETTAESENCVIVVGLDDGQTISKDVIKINLSQPSELQEQEQLPTEMSDVAVATVYCNTMYVTGIGVDEDEIWKYNMASGWMKCASLAHGRCRHSAAFIDEVLYICGGYNANSNERFLDSVEAYNAVTNTCSTVGRLIHGVESSGSVPVKRSLYIFGGFGNGNKVLKHVQVFNTKENTCSVLLRPMPRPYGLMQAVLWDTSVILLGRYTCFIFNLETETWQERKRFKTDVLHFGMVLENERIFVIGGGTVSGTDDDDKHIWNCRDDVRYVPLQNILNDEPIEWKLHGKLPKPSLVHAYANMRLLV